VAILADLLKDFALGEHMLLIGNQGVGKNKLIDRMLELLGALLLLLLVLLFLDASGWRAVRRY
jgi:MoxR-like ATPase